MARQTAYETRPIKYNTTDEIRAALQWAHTEMEKTLSHMKKVLEEYADIEDELNEIDRAVLVLQNETGLTKQYIEDTTGMSDFEIEMEEN